MKIKVIVRSILCNNLLIILIINFICLISLIRTEKVYQKQDLPFNLKHPNSQKMLINKQYRLTQKTIPGLQKSTTSINKNTAIISTSDKDIIIPLNIVPDPIIKKLTINPDETKNKSRSNFSVNLIEFLPLNCEKLQNGKCIKCYNRYYLNSSNICVQVNKLCKDYNERGQCTQCYQGYKLIGVGCVVAFPVGIYCRQFRQDVCVSCYAGYYLTPIRLCKRLNPLCRKFNPQTEQCQLCYRGYTLTRPNNCNIAITDPQCVQSDRNNPKICILCLDANKYHVSKISGKCQQINPYCSQFVVDGNTNVRKCIRCYDGYYLNQLLQCIKVNYLCKSYDKVNGNCLSCYPGYVLTTIAISDENSTSKQTKNTMIQCTIDNNQIHKKCKTLTKQNQTTQCKQCYPSYTLIHGKCQQINPNCRTVDERTHACTSCWPGYVLKQSGIGRCVPENQLIKISLVYDQFCEEVRENVCVRCLRGYGYSLQSKRCEQLDPLCLTFSSQPNRTNVCTACVEGYVLESQKNSCISVTNIQLPYCLQYQFKITRQQTKCKQCLQGYYIQKHKCRQIPIGCAQFTPEDNTCTKCLQGFVLQLNQCIRPSIYDVNCVFYENSYCSQCKVGFYVKDFVCLKTDPYCIRFNNINNLCLECQGNRRPFHDICVSQ